MSRPPRQRPSRTAGIEVNQLTPHANPDPGGLRSAPAHDSTESPFVFPVSRSQTVNSTGSSGSGRAVGRGGVEASPTVSATVRGDRDREPRRQLPARTGTPRENTGGPFGDPIAFGEGPSQRPPRTPPVRVKQPQEINIGSPPQSAFFRGDDAVPHQPRRLPPTRSATVTDHTSSAQHYLPEQQNPIVSERRPSFGRRPSQRIRGDSNSNPPNQQYLRGDGPHQSEDVKPIDLDISNNGVSIHDAPTLRPSIRQHVPHSPGGLKRVSIMENPQIDVAPPPQHYQRPRLPRNPQAPVQSSQPHPDYSDSEDDVFQPGQGAQPISIRSSNLGTKSFSPLVITQSDFQGDRSSVRAGGRALNKQPSVSTPRALPQELNSISIQPETTSDDDTEPDDVLDFIKPKIGMPPKPQFNKGSSPIAKASKPASQTASTTSSSLSPPAIATSAEVDALNAQIETLQKALDMAKHDSERLKSALAERGDELAPILSLLTEKEQQVSKLMEAVVHAKRAVDDSRAERDDALKIASSRHGEAESQLSKIQVELKQVVREKSDLEKELAETKGKIVETENKLLEIEQERDDAEMQVDELFEEREATVKSMDETTKKLSAAEATVLKLKKEIDLVKLQEEESARRLAAAEGRLQSHEVSLRNAQNSANHAVNEVQSRGAAVDNIEEELKETLAQLHFAKSRQVELEKQLEDVESQLKLAEDATTRDTSQIASAMAEIESLKSELVKVGAVKSDAGNATQELDHTLKQALQERDEALSELSILKADIQELEQMFEDSQNEVAELRGKLKKMETNEDSEVIKKLEQELEDALNDIDDLQAQLQFASSNSEHNTDAENLQASLQEANHEIENLRKLLETNKNNGSGADAAKLKELEDALEDSKYEIEDLLIKTDDANANVAELEKILEEERAYVDSVDEANKILKGEIATLQEKLERQKALVGADGDGDTQNIVNSLQDEIAALQDNLKELENQLDQSEAANQKLTNDLDRADKEFEALMDELDATKEDADINAELRSKLEAAEKELQELRLRGGATKPEKETTSEDQKKLRDRIAALEEEVKGGNASLIEQLRDQELDAKEMRETLVQRLQVQESEAAILREEINRLKSECENAAAKLKTAESSLEDYRSQAKSLETKYLERCNMLEELLTRSYDQIEGLRIQIVQEFAKQQLEPPVFNPLPEIPPANFHPPPSPTLSAEKAKPGFLSSIWNGMKEDPLSPATDLKEDALKNKQSTGILRSLWNGSTNAPPSTLSSEPPSDINAIVVGADEDDLPKQPPSTFLASIWNSKSNLKKTGSGQ